MSINWTNWILEKNAKAQEESLKKSDFVQAEVLEKGFTGQLKSKGCIDFGNNQIHEVMQHKKTNKIYLAEHGDNPLKTKSYVPHHKFMADLHTHQPHHVDDVKEQLSSLGVK